MTITISFQYHIQDSVSVGDVAYYVTVVTDGGFDINSGGVVEIGEITAVDRANKTITCDTALFGNQTPSAKEGSHYYHFYSLWYDSAGHRPPCGD